MLINELSKLISRLVRSTYILPPLFLVAIFYFFYKNYIIPNAILVGDLRIPYPAPLLNQLSSPVPWYSMFSYFFYVNFFNIYGYIFNALQIFLYIPAYFSMYLLLRNLKIKKLPAVLFSIFYLLNLVVFTSVFSYSNLMWSEFYVFAPLLILFLLRYHNTSDIRNIIIFSILLSIYIEIQTAPTFYNLRLILPIILVPYFYSLIEKLRHKERRKRVVIENALSIVIFVGLNIVPVIQLLSSSLSLIPESGNSAISFEALHYGNVVYTYQSQNLIFAISGLVVYPSFQNSLLMGYGQPFFVLTLSFDLFIIISVIVVMFSARKDDGFIKSIAISVLIIWAFITLTQSGVLLPFFKRFSFMYLWEYPTYLEMTLFVLYPILLATFFSKDFTTYGLFNKKFKIPNFVKLVYISVKAKKNRKLFVQLAIVFVIFAYFAPVIYSNSNGFAPLPQYETEQPFYNNIFKFFEGKGVDYKVMILPFNQSTYKALGSAVPDSQIFALPYAYQNNPSAFANVTLFNSIYSDINDSSLYNFSSLLNYSGIEYIITLSGSVKTSEVNLLQNLSYLNLVQERSNYKIFQYDYFSPVKVLANPFFLNNTGFSKQFSNTMVISKNSNFTNRSGYSVNRPYTTDWNEWSSNLQYYDAFKFYTRYISVGVFGNSSIKGSQMSEIYQRVAIPPGSSLTLISNVFSGNNSRSSLFVIAHSNTSNITPANFFSPYQYYKDIPDNLNGTISMEINVSYHTEYVYFGVMVWNKSAGKGYINLSSITLFLNKRINLSSYSRTIVSSLPFPIFDYSLPMQVHTGYNIVSPIYSDINASTIPPISWTFIPNEGIGVINSSISVNITPRLTFMASFKTLSNSSLMLNGKSYRGNNVNVEINGTTDLKNITLLVKGSTILTAFVLIKTLSSNFIHSIKININNTGALIKTTNKSGSIIVVFSPFATNYKTNSCVETLSSQNIRGETMIIYFLNSNATIAIKFKESQYNPYIIALNLDSFTIMMSLLIILIFANYIRVRFIS